MIIKVDTREKLPIIKKNILTYFESQDIQYIRCKLDVGDYMSVENPSVVIDRKHDLGELCGNVSGVPKKNRDGSIKRYADGRPMTEYVRFTNELELANKLDKKMIILCEHGGRIHRLEDVRLWKNPRLKDSRFAISGDRLCMKLIELQKKYGVRFVFCDKRQTGKRIVELLEGRNGPS